jgi:periplasmic protein TonB
MKYFLTLLIILCCTGLGWSQEETPVVKEPEKRIIKEAGPEAPPVILDGPVEAEFPGGHVALRNYIAANLVYPEAAKQKEISGRCYLRFTISAEGKVTDVKVARGIPDCPECDAEAVRVVSAMPDWKPGEMDGKPVATYFNLPVTFEPR